MSDMNLKLIAIFAPIYNLTAELCLREWNKSTDLTNSDEKYFSLVVRVSPRHVCVFLFLYLKGIGIIVLPQSSKKKTDVFHKPNEFSLNIKQIKNCLQYYLLSTPPVHPVDNIEKKY